MHLLAPLHEDFARCLGCKHEVPREDLCQHTPGVCPTCCATEDPTD